MDIYTLALSIAYSNKIGKQIKDQVNSFKIQIESDRSILDGTGQENIFYFLPKTVGKPQDGYDEYIYINNSWELMGGTDIDLSGYMTLAPLLTPTQEEIAALPDGQWFRVSNNNGSHAELKGAGGGIFQNDSYNQQHYVSNGQIDSSIDESSQDYFSTSPITNKPVLGHTIMSLGLSMPYMCCFKSGDTFYYYRLEQTQYKTKSVQNKPNHYFYPSEKCMVDYIAATTYTKAQVDNLISAISTLSFEVAQTKPVSNIQTNVIYLIPKSTAETNNVYDEWIYVNNAWELIGSTQIDLSQYAQKSELPTKTSDLTNDSGFLTQHQDISGKADKATTLAGYGITNAYTKTETDQKVEAASPFIVNLYSDDHGGFESLEINGAQLLRTCFDVQSNLPRCIRAYKIYGFENRKFVEIYIDMILPLGANTYKWIGHTTDENGTVTMYSYQSTANNRIHFIPEGDPDAD